MNVLDTSIANVSIPAIAGEMGVSANQGTWVITSFAVANAIAVPLTGWLTHRFGQVRLFCLSTALFVLDDELALRVHMVLSERGLRVPDDISIIAPGDVLDYSKPYIPQFNTMRINTDIIGSTTGEFLMNRLRHAKQKLYGLKVNQEFVDRGSCAPPNPGVSASNTVARTARAIESLAAR